MPSNKLNVQLPKRLDDKGLMVLATVRGAVVKVDVINAAASWEADKHDTEDALYATKQAVLRKYPKRGRSLSFFEKTGASGEVSYWRAEMPK